MKELHRDAIQPKLLDIFRKRQNPEGFNSYDELREQEILDSYAAQAEMLDGLREIYRYHGEDKHIADTCNRLIEKYGRPL